MCLRDKRKNHKKLNDLLESEVELESYGQSSSNKAIGINRVIEKGEREARMKWKR